MDSCAQIRMHTKFTASRWRALKVFIPLPFTRGRTPAQEGGVFGGEKDNMLIKDLAVERRKKARFPMNRELRYKLLEGDTIVEVGLGTTFDMGSGGIAFLTERELPVGSFIELAISWPVLLEDSCPMRLIVFGRVVRGCGRLTACTADKYEFRTQARVLRPVAPVRNDSMLQRWADNIRKESMKTATA
jgi:hypothetical protein